MNTHLPLLSLLVLTLPGTQAAQPDAAATEWDATHVGTDVPATVVADQVFVAKVTMKNTGTRAWSDALKLRSQEPLDNTVWGTSFIYLGQGRSCKPGEEITFSSNLKAPGRPGKYGFRWRMARNQDGSMFSEPTPLREIVVTPRRANPPPAPPRPPASGKRVLSAEDFAYLGSFKLPKSVEGCGSGFTESGLALRKAADGTKTLFVQTGLQKYLLYEADIPEPLPLDTPDHSRLKVAAVQRVWGEIKLGDGADAVRANAGFWWDESKQTLYWSYYHGYMTGIVPVLGASRLEAGRAPAHAGPWRIPAAAPWYKCYWGGVTPLQRAFADRYTGGRRLALGFGGYYSICAAASRGPALAAIAEPDPLRATVDLVELLAYPWPKEVAAPRDGDYFVANCPWGGQPPESPSRGQWTMDDAVHAGVFLDLPDGHAFLALAYLGTGRIGYDYGAIQSAGHACWWYFYNPDDLGAVATGSRKPWEVLPHSRTKVTYPSGLNDSGLRRPPPGDVTGCCFDEETRRLYLYQRFVLDDGSRERQPCIHVYVVKSRP